MAKKSEFGAGLTYCLGLFLSHAERYDLDKRYMQEIKEKTGKDFGLLRLPSTWFNASSDHLYELQIPKNLSKELKKRLKNFQDKCLDLGHGDGLMGKIEVKEEDVIWAIEEAKELLRLIDLNYEINAIEANYK
ncbi:MAG: hypothetical protein AABY22_27120 [Nanoarchaeota archaeon]